MQSTTKLAVRFHAPALPDVDGFLDDVREIVTSGWLSDGVHVGRLERRFADLSGAIAAVAVSNCSDGLIAARSVLARPGSEVILPGYTYLATWQSIERLLGEGRRLVTLIHPSAVVARSAEIGPGCVIFPNVVIGARTVVGAGTIVNRGALVGHHGTIGAGSFLAPGANVGGGVTLGEQVHVGIGAVIRDDRRVGDHAVVGAGAVVVADVDAGITVVGLPAKPMATRPD